VTHAFGFCLPCAPRVGKRLPDPVGTPSDAALRWPPVRFANRRFIPADLVTEDRKALWRHFVTPPSWRLSQLEAGATK
jgi:hypothetical protein